MAGDKNGKNLPKGITQRPDRRYMGRFTYQGESYCLYGDKVRELEKRLNDLRYEVEHGLHGSTKRISLNQWFDEWMRVYKQTTAKRSTQDYFIRYYDLYIRKALGSKEIKNIKAVHIQKIINDMVKKGYKVNTLVKVRNILNNMFVFAVNNDILIKNPCSAVVLPKREQVERRVLTAEEQRKFLAYVHDSAMWQRYESLFLVAFGTGMRIGELLALNWTDIDFKEKIITINKTLYYGKEGGKYKFTIQTPKTETSNREIPALSHVIKILKRQKMEQLQHKMMIGDKWEPLKEEGFNNLIFTTVWGKPIDRNAVNRTIKSIVTELNKQEQKTAEIENRKPELMEGFSSHTMRHTFATRCFEQEMRPKVVQQFLGHSTLAMTMDLYTHVTKQTEVDEIQKLEAVF